MLLWLLDCVFHDKYSLVLDLVMCWFTAALWISIVSASCLSIQACWRNTCTIVPQDCCNCTWFCNYVLPWKMWGVFIVYSKDRKQLKCLYSILGNRLSSMVGFLEWIITSWVTLFMDTSYFEHSLSRISYSANDYTSDFLTLKLSNVE